MCGVSIHSWTANAIESKRDIKGKASVEADSPTCSLETPCKASQLHRKGRRGNKDTRVQWSVEFSHVLFKGGPILFRPRPESSQRRLGK